ncbi:LysR family transcriptional regulator [Massilia sp. HP4]|uniref:LysR family transcriptional regulator n=1 Tax=Massilia sp. HP4 TaxID=2562316 RepID=UPI0010C09B9C|nr:LysR family transcriptional regulator [Massilia sp. HP4]
MDGIESLSGIATFVAVARASSFTQAGEMLGISKSAVGKAVARLEERLGVKLFHRTTRRLALTADGEAYFAVCARALEGIAEAEGSLGGKLLVPAGRLRIDMPAAFGRKVMLPILLDIARAYPALQLTLTFTDDVIDLVEEGVDLAIRFGTLEDSSDLVARRLTSHRWVIGAAPVYLETHGLPDTLADISRHDCIVGYRRGRPLAWHVVENGQPARLAPPPTHQISDAEAMLDAAVAGIGLCQMPLALMRPYIDAGQLVTVLDDCTPREIDVHAVWPRTSHLRPKVRHVVDTLVKLGREGRLD